MGAWAADGRGRIWLTVRGSDTLVRIDPQSADPAATAAVISSPLIHSPDGVWIGDDGGMWFANTNARCIGRVDPDADDPSDTVQTYGDSTHLEEPFDIKAGPEGWLWFTDKSRGTLGRVFASA
jgi:virginiamycin B lyase